eukprot:CAMPEP_0194089262 /NCGR_PEP_ID=MMETSP0149-20130528/33447_1 /TAXON_ID=122233 /ORGANISM="Chaetoceros debilis, Strain MM31A-1" /LENGTH=36 /DNA_ID= /DNA_START= /DNA_END= /DNA_ORIENTATION=
MRDMLGEVLGLVDELTESEHDMVGEALGLSDGIADG